MLPITRKISSYNHSAPNNIKYIVIHDTGNITDSASGNANYFNAADRGASAHYFVDNNSIYQVVEDNEGAWHCGDGGGAYGITNHNSIGIEMCRNNGAVTATTENNTLELVKYLMNKYGVSVDRVKTHHDASRKNCPSSFSANNWARWNQFKARLNGQAVPTTEPQGNPNDVYEVSTCNPTHVVVGDDFFVRDSQGYLVNGRIVSNGDKIQVVSSKNDLLEVIYPSSVSKTGFMRGFIKNIPTLLNPITPVTSQPVQSTNTKHQIMGTSDLTVQQMTQFLLQNNPTPSINCTALELAQIFLEEGAKENIRGDFAFAQAIKETGYFKFGGDVIPEQNNYCGLGTTGGGVKGAYFESPRIGVRAMVQHLKAYASTESLKQPCVDPRYNLIATKGIAPNLEDLNGRWAVPGNNYGQEIYSLYEKIKAIKVDSTPIQPTTPTITQPTVSQPTPVKNIFTYPNNAQVVGDDLYIRDINSNVIPNRYVSNGDKITVLDVLYSKQLTLVQYPTSSGVRSGYVKNVTNLIKYFNSYNWQNGSTPEDVFDKPNGIKIGSLSAKEKATKLFITKDGWTCVVYDTDKGSHTKSGFVKFAGV